MAARILGRLDHQVMPRHQRNVFSGTHLEFLLLFVSGLDCKFFKT
jgi:hypothetical protein